MKDDFQIFNKFKVFGKPDGKIWFIGLEEAANFEVEYEQNLLNYSKEVLCFEKGLIEKDAKELGNSYTKVYDIMSKIMVGILKENDWKTYRNSKLLTDIGNEFQINLYPLGKKNLKSWSELYERKFEFKNKKEYLNYVQAHRFPILYNFWKQNSPKFTICFGLGNFNDFIKAFQLESESKIEDKNLYLFKKEKLIITPFFHNGHMGQKKIDKTVKIINNEI